MGGQAQTDRFARLYMIPGMGHRADGRPSNTSDLMLHMVKQVEDGQAPLGPAAPTTKDEQAAARMARRDCRL
ncbi:tannase/feruloyl esterase family alpha/beta hydrolase [Streptomyces sp. NPDC048564]|uniref:tannase/feruloyl esterase family alpha/beta hydrolase n=1 Tax=unclassified Streptomyces TaxID=2593676 RepID=UPI0034364401